MPFINLIRQQKVEKYTDASCNIKNCTLPYYKDLLCKRHYQKYAIDSKSQKILARLYRIELGSPTFKDRLIVAINNIFHYTLLLSFYYVEHFKLETLFHYHYKNVDIKNNKLYKPEEFIRDFDYDDNDRIGYLKTHTKSKDSQDEILKFVEEDSPNMTLVYSFLFSIFAIVLITTKIFSQLSLPTEHHFDTILLLGFMLIPTIYFGETYIKNCKQIMKLAIENKLYETTEDNNLFLESCESIFNRMKIYREMILSCAGGTIAIFLYIIISIKDNLVNEKWFIYLITYFLSIIAVLLFRWFFKLLWLNYFFMPLSRRFHNAPLKLELYDLDKNSGLTPIKQFQRNLLLYDILIIATICVASYFKQYENMFLLWFLTFVTGWNITSLFVFIPKMNILLHRQFKTAIHLEKEQLSASKSSDRFIKYEFIDKLRLNTFFSTDLLKKILFGSLTFIFTFLVRNYNDQIIDLLKTYIIA